MASPVLRSHGAFKENSPQAQTQAYVPQPNQYGQPNQFEQPNQYAHPDQLQEMYQAPAATPIDTGRMTYDHVITRTGALLGIIIAVGAVTWFTVPGLFIVGAIAGLILGLVNAFRKEPSKPLIMAYAAAEGMFLGGISAFFETIWPGVVFQAVLATVATFAITLLLYRSRAIRVTSKLRRFVTVALLGYLAFSVINFGLMLFAGDQFGMFGLRSAQITIPVIGTVSLGVIVGIIAVLLATMSLLTDFDAIERGVEQGVPERYGWTAAFGLTVTLVWLYLELLRLLSIFRD